MEETEEDYWTSSRVKANRKTVNIFDDHVRFEAASDLAKFKKSVEEDEDTIGWDESPTSTPFPPTPESRPEEVVKPKHVFTPDVRSPVIDPGPSLSLFENVEKEASFRQSPSAQQSQEVIYLRQQLELAQRSLGGTKQKPEETIKKLINGMPFSLEQYKSRDEKLDLLDKAIQTHDGNAIIAAVMFLKRTLSEQIFNLELMRRPVAVDQYLAYLKAHFKFRDLELMLGLLGRTEELAMFKLRQAMAVNDACVKIDKLKQCLKAHLEHSPGLELHTSLIQQQVALLHRQRPVDVADDMLEKEGKHVVFRAVPRVRSIVNMPVITTLFYCCTYHYEEAENLLSSPAAIRKEHQLTEKQYLWTAVKARAKLKKWGDVDALFMTKGWLGGTKMKCILGFDKVAAVLHKSGAPSDIIAKFLKNVDDVEKRLELASKMQCHEAVIETYQSQRDRKSLEMYQAKLKPTSKEWFLIKDILSNSSTKWKT